MRLRHKSRRDKVGQGVALGGVGNAKIIEDSSRGAGDAVPNRILKYFPRFRGGDPYGQTHCLRIRNDEGKEVLTPYYTPSLRQPLCQPS
jgi:hypothetical protein